MLGEFKARQSARDVHHYRSHRKHQHIHSRQRLRSLFFDQDIAETRLRNSNLGKSGTSALLLFFRGPRLQTVYTAHAKVQRAIIPPVGGTSQCVHTIYVHLW